MDDWTTKYRNGAAQVICLEELRRRGEEDAGLLLYHWPVDALLSGMTSQVEAS